MIRQEEGNTYELGLRSRMIIDFEAMSQAPPIPSELTLLNTMALHPAFKGELKQFVFIGGSIYKNISGETYREENTWREDLALPAVLEAKKLFLHGKNFDAHDKNTGLGIGFAFQRIYLSTFYLIHGLDRIGIGTAYEAQIATANLGCELGLILNKDDYESARSHLENIHNPRPECLPTYLEVELDPDDLICGYEDLPRWISERSKTIRPKNFRHIIGLPPKLQSYLQFYGKVYAYNDQEMLELAVKETTENLHLFRL